MKVWSNGVLHDPERAQVSVFDHGLLVGDGVFETIKVVHGEPFTLTRHLDRLAVMEVFAARGAKDVER